MTEAGTGGRRPARRRTDPVGEAEQVASAVPGQPPAERYLLEVAARLRGLLDIAETASAGASDLGTAAERTAGTAREARAVTGQATTEIAQIASAGASGSSVAGFAAGVAGLTDLLLLNSDIDAATTASAADDGLLRPRTGVTAPADEIMNLARETAQAAGTLVVQMQAVTESSAQALESVATIGTALDDIAGQQVELAARAVTQAAVLDQLISQLRALALGLGSVGVDGAVTPGALGGVQSRG